MVHEDVELRVVYVVVHTVLPLVASHPMPATAAPTPYTIGDAMIAAFRGGSDA